MKAIEAKKALQGIVGVDQDGDIGPKTLAAVNALSDAPDDSEWPPVAAAADLTLHHVKATSFADPADVAAFRHCKAQGNTDNECLAVGDNGVGKWGDDCTEGSGPICALPPEDWLPFEPHARGKKVIVHAQNGKSVTCELRDTMPHKAHIQNGAGIDLNPDACAALGFHPPLSASVAWEWA